MRVLITDFLAESDFEREVLLGVEVDALLSLIGHPVLAICGIRRPELACENTSCFLLLRARSREEAYNLKHASAHLYTGGMNTVQRILTFITGLTRFCLQLLQHSYVTWTTPGPPRCCR